MTALWIVGGFLAVLLLILVLFLLLRIGALVRYDADGLRAFVKIGPVQLDLFQMVEKSKRKKKVPAAQNVVGQRKRGTPADLKAALSDVQGLLQAFVPRIRFDQLSIHYVVAGAGDPCAAALRFGSASAFFGTVLPVLENISSVRKRDLRTSADFTAENDQVQLCLLLTVAALDIVKYLLPFVLHAETKTDSALDSKRKTYAVNTIDRKGGQFNG
jgi:hypothetical protein